MLHLLEQGTRSSTPDPSLAISTRRSRRPRLVVLLANLRLLELGTQFR
ncbi:hypothetical protein PAHAL_5G259800 [Panicum hallii]|uniref:Uncharacterized protein n=1 Tax=Panicum hallii TaxID=206008 RepID=A0A2T8IL93_9POAL|nr:hypothetical protein PAHAL_5G259800 [Panicum hallii]